MQAKPRERGTYLAATEAMPHLSTSHPASRARHDDSSTSIRLASLRIERGVQASCTLCDQAIADADLACAVTLEGFRPARTMTFHDGCYRAWTRSQGDSNGMQSTDAELAEGLQE